MNRKFTCKYCKRTFERSTHGDRKHYDFCSRSCSNKSRVLKKIPCPLCKTLFEPAVVDNGGVRRKYCSIKCANAAKRGKPSTNPKTHSKEERDFVKTHYPEKGADWVSEKLGHTKKSIYMLANKIGVRLNKDVYRVKVHDAAKKYMTGEKNPNWQGGVTCDEWGDNWQEQKRAARKRDDYRCQVCGYFSRHITVHHIKPRRLFAGNMNDANVLSNLICLCDKHHVPVEVGKIPCPTPKP